MVGAKRLQIPIKKQDCSKGPQRSLKEVQHLIKREQNALKITTKARTFGQMTKIHNNANGPM